jgi:hypothetical protein
MLVADPELGVVADARRRQWRRRGVVAAAILGVVAWLAFAHGPAARHGAPPRLSSSLRYLSGPALGHTGIRLIASENGGRPYLIDLDSSSAQPVTGLALPASVGAPERTSVQPLIPFDAGALAFVRTQPCTRCGSTQVEYLIDRQGRARRLGALSLGYHQTFTPAIGSTAGWVYTWPHRGPCSLALEPGAQRAVTVPCGGLFGVSSAGVLIGGLLVDPMTGHVRLRVKTAGRSIELIHGTLALGAAGASGDLTSLALVDLRTGARRPLGWPSRLHFGFQVFPAPHGPLVALLFGQPWYPPSQAADVWVLNTSTGSLTEVPGFPALELLKFSTIAWTADDRLVVASTGPRRTIVGVWRPGQRTMALRTVPPLHGYTSVVPLVP